MDISKLLIGLIIANIVTGGVLVITLPAIITRFKFMLARFTKLGIARMLGNDKRIRTYVKDLRAKTLSLKKNTYYTDPLKIVYEDGIPVLNYKEGLVEALDLMTDQLQDWEPETKLDSKQLSDIVIRSYSVGKSSAQRNNDLMLYIMLAGTGASIATLGMVYKIMQVVGG